MRALNSLLAASVVLAAASAASAALVTITNPGFELDINGNQLTADTKMSWGTHWGEVTPGNWGWVPAANYVQGWHAESWDTATKVTTTTSNDSSYAAAINNDGWAQITQDPSVNNIVIAEGTYTLSAMATAGWPGNISAHFLAQGTDGVVGWLPKSTFSADGNFVNHTAVVWTVAAGDPNIGKNLGFGFVAADDFGGNKTDNVAIDNVTLDFVAVPEPATMGLLAGAGLMMLSRRRNAAK